MFPSSNKYGNTSFLNLYIIGSKLYIGTPHNAYKIAIYAQKLLIYTGDIKRHTTSCSYKVIICIFVVH